MDNIEAELDMAVSKAEQEVAAARSRRDAFRQRIMYQRDDDAYLIQFATWLGRETSSCNCSAPNDVVRLLAIAERLKAIIIRE